MTVFLPKEITIGFQEREGTYTGKLAYIIYKDEKGILRKEKSWNSWRSKEIEPQIKGNVPISGFVLNKKTGGYATGWNHRQSYIRVYDPRGFEFEITIENLLYILENTNSIKGKGLDGEFVYGWDGKDLILVPTDSPDYKEIIEYSEKVKDNKKISIKDLIIGGTYLTKKNENLIYIGKYDSYNTYSGHIKAKEHFFYNVETNNYESYKSISGKFINIVDDKCCLNYSDLFSNLESLSIYSPIDNNNYKFEEYSFDDFDAKLKNSSYYACLYCFYKNENNEYSEIYVRNNIKTNEATVEVKIDLMNYYNYKTLEKNISVKEIFEKYKPLIKIKYLKNGKEFKGEDRYNEK